MIFPNLSLDFESIVFIEKYPNSNTTTSLPTNDTAY